MNLKSTSRSPAPGVQQQQQAESLSKQRAQQQQAQQQQAAQAQQAANAAYAGMHMSPGYPSSPHAAQQQQQQQMYGNMYSPNHQGAPPPYPSQPSSAAPYGQQMPPMIQQPPPAAGSMHPYGQQQQQNNLYAQATTRAGRQRASTVDGNGIPQSLQRVVSHLDPNAPIRLQPSPAYYPPPAEGAESSVGNVGGRRRTSRGPRHGQQDRNFVRVLEDRTLEEGWTGNGGGGWPGA